MILNPYKKATVWFCTGSQHLYGEGPLRQVAENASAMIKALNRQKHIPVKIIFKPVLTRPEEITRLLLEANLDKNCVGVITWMHTFSPAKMWINGLKHLTKPLLHLHTQFNRDIPWKTIDMDFMNLNQSAHGDREFGFINTRLNTRRKVLAGYWEDPALLSGIGQWARVAVAWHDWQTGKIARFGDNMREVAVTEGNKVSAQIQFGFSVNGYGIGDLVKRIEGVSKKEVDGLLKDYEQEYTLSSALASNGRKRKALEQAARIELGLTHFLSEGHFFAFTDTFEDLHGLDQLPGIAVQRLMHQGFGFGAEGDWKTAALVRAMKVMAFGLPGGNSFMEDYTYHLMPGNQQVLGAHMLEICPSIANHKPSCEIHPLGIGGKADPVRLVFNTAEGNGLNASLIDLGHRFRLLVNTVEVVSPDHPLPKLPVARVLWKAHPDFSTAATAWILAGGAHHTCFSQNLTISYLEDFVEMANIELLVISQTTELHQFKNEIRWNDKVFA